MNGYEFKSTRRKALKIISAAIIAVVVWLTARFTRFFVKPKQKITFILKTPLRRVRVEAEIFIVPNGKSLTVLSRTCPHLGCKVRLDEQKQRFICPCHGSQFQLNGRFIAGPAQKPLMALPFKKSGNQITVTL